MEWNHIKQAHSLELLSIIQLASYIGISIDSGQGSEISSSISDIRLHSATQEYYKTVCCITSPEARMLYSATYVLIDLDIN